jgi:hypothetical protein
VAEVSRPARTFNTPLEAGLRALFILAAAGRRSMDTQRLMYFDYLLIHSGTVSGPESLHPPTNSQKGELLVRRALLQEGLELMRSRDLIERRFQATGIAYGATRVGRHLVDQFQSDYSSLLRQRADWVVERFSDLSNERVAATLGAQVGNWDDELIAHSDPGALEGSAGA